MQRITKKNMYRVILAVCVMVLFVAAAALTAGAEEETVAYFYINSEIGVDTNSGMSADQPVATFTRACNLAKQAYADKAVLVFTNAYSIPKTVKEVAHPDMPFVLTTKDDKVDYGAQGAKIVYGSGLRYYLNGDTTFENLTYEYTKSIVFVAQYNHITFGDNVNLSRLDNEDNVVYVVGGYQSPLDDFDTSLDSHITIKSGDFDYVIGGSRQKGTGASGTTYTGTHYLDISGGTVAKLFGGSYNQQICDSAVINISGGEIDLFYVAGDATRRLEKDATVTLSGGTITEMHVNNVIGAATVTLKGANVGSMDFTYANSDQTTWARKANKDDILYYDANYYTKEQIDSYSGGFTAVENVTKVYVKEGATGSGATESDPTSFANAVSVVASTGGTITVIGSIDIGDYTEPAHTETIVIEGESSTSTVNIGGTYTFSGPTAFRGLRLDGKGNVNAKNGSFIVNDTVKLFTEFDIIGSAELYTGTYGNITDAGHVIVAGATVGTVTGGTDSLTVEVTSGKVGTVKTTETSIKNVTLNVSGGEVEKVIFNNVTGSLSYLLFGGSVKAYEVAGKNVTGELTMNTELFTVESLGAAASIFEQNNTIVYYLRDGGTGNGTSVNAAGGTLADAYAAIGDNDGVIVVCGTYTVGSAAFVAPKHGGEILLTSVYDGVDYRKTDDAAVVINANFYCGGDTVMDDLHIINKKLYGGLFAAYHNLTLGSGITTAPGGSTSLYPSIVGGTYEVVENVSGEVTINGGTWQRVRLGNSAAVPVNADLKMTFNAGVVKEKLTMSTNTSHTGNLELVINGGTFGVGIVGTAMPQGDYSFNGTMTVVLNGGNVYGTIEPMGTEYGTLHGNWNVVINDQNPVNLVDIKGTAGLPGDMVSTLYVSENVDLNASVTGTTSFTNPVRSNGADPWLFYHDGYYYYIATAGSALSLVKATNIGDLSMTSAQVIYDPESGHEWSKDLWSPEIHHFSAEEIGEEYAGWYCFLGSNPDDEYYQANGKADDPAGFGDQRAYVIKCLDGDNLLGRWGNPLTGEVNVPQKIAFPDSDFNDKELTGGCSVITINGVKYITFISEVGRETSGTDEYNFYQTINIAKFTNPWTIEGEPKVICKPEYDWEKGGSADRIHPEVVEGSTAVYGPNGEVYIIYSGSGYWTAMYQLGQLTYIGGPNGDPTDISNWEKKPTSIFSQSDELTGCGHASYVTDTNGQGWICYHAYPKGSSERRAYVEPYYFTEDGVVIGNRSGHPESVSKVYTVTANPLPIANRVSGFDKTETVEEKFAFTRDYDGRFTDVTEKHWFYSYVKNAYRMQLANGTSATKFSPDNTFTVAQALTAAANIHTVYNGTSVRKAAAGEKWFDPYVEYCVQNGIITAEQFANYDANITRGDMAVVFANILPDSEYAAVKSGANPDVTSDMTCYDAVAKLYKAGIVGGDAGTGNYRPNDSIKRSEACVIFSRIAMKTERAY